MSRFNVLQRNDKLIATVANDGIRQTNALTKNLGRLLQHRVAGLVSDFLIDLLEVIQIRSTNKTPIGTEC